MYIKKRTGYIVRTQNESNLQEKLSVHDAYQVFKIGRVLTPREETEFRLKKNMNIDSIKNQGFYYYQVISNPGACEKCEEHNGAIYPVANATEIKTLPPFHPNCKCEIRGFSTQNPTNDPWTQETLLWLDIMYGDGTPEQNAQRLLDFYNWTDYSVGFIAGILSSTDKIENIGKRIEEFLRLLDANKTGQSGSYSQLVSDTEGRSGNWTIPNEEFVDGYAMDYADIVKVFASCGNPIYEADPEYYASVLMEICHNYEHSSFAYDSSFGHISVYNEVKAGIPDGAVGINPKVLLATLKAESTFGKRTSSLFGSLGSRRGNAIITDPDMMREEFRAQLDVAVSRYIRFYYYAPYYETNFPGLYVRGDAHGSGGGSYTPANAAMFARGQYCTEGLDSTMVWHDYFHQY